MLGSKYASERNPVYQKTQRNEEVNQRSFNQSVGYS